MVGEGEWGHKSQCEHVCFLFFFFSPSSFAVSLLLFLSPISFSHTHSFCLTFPLFYSFPPSATIMPPKKRQFVPPECTPLPLTPKPVSSLSSESDPSSSSSTSTNPSLQSSSQSTSPTVVNSINSSSPSVPLTPTSSSSILSGTQRPYPPSLSSQFNDISRGVNNLLPRSRGFSVAHVLALFDEASSNTVSVASVKDQASKILESSTSLKDFADSIKSKRLEMQQKEAAEKEKLNSTTSEQSDEEDSSVTTSSNIPFVPLSQAMLDNCDFQYAQLCDVHENKPRCCFCLQSFSGYRLHQGRWTILRNAFNKHFNKESHGDFLKKIQPKMSKSDLSQLRETTLHDALKRQEDNKKVQKTLSIRGSIIGYTVKQQ